MLFRSKPNGGATGKGATRRPFPPWRSNTQPGRAVLTRLEAASGWIAKSRLRAYGLAVLTTVIALAIRLALNPILATRPTYSLFLFSVLVTAVLAGSRPALLATVLSAAAVESPLYGQSQPPAVLTRDVLEVA